MPTGMFEYRDEGERRAIERAVAFVAEMRNLAQRPGRASSRLMRNAGRRRRS